MQWRCIWFLFLCFINILRNLNATGSMTDTFQSSNIGNDKPGTLSTLKEWQKETYIPSWVAVLGTLGERNDQVRSSTTGILLYHSNQERRKKNDKRTQMASLSNASYKSQRKWNTKVHTDDLLFMSSPPCSYILLHHRSRWEAWCLPSWSWPPRNQRGRCQGFHCIPKLENR